MQISTVRYQDLNPEFRIDAEYHREEVLNRLNVLKRHNKDRLENLVDFVIGPFGSTVTADKYVNRSEYRYVRNKDVNDFCIKDNEPALIPKEVYDSFPKFHIQENDLLITVVGTLGKVAIATHEDTKAIFSCKSTIIRAKNINPFYLLAYLNSDIGKLFSLRGKRGVIQEGLNLTDLREIQIFIPSEVFQQRIEERIKKSFAGRKKSIMAYTQAQNLLLAELGLADWQTRHQLTFVKNYSDTEQVGRIDADYFQLRYEEIVNAIKGYAGGWYTLGDLVTVKKCVEVGSNEYLDKGVPFVRVSNLSPFEITEEKYISDKLYKEMKQHQPEKEEILFSKDGTPGIAYLFNEAPQKMIPSSGILRLKNATQKVNNEYLILVLNSLLLKEQISRDVGGSIILHWRPDQVKRAIIPILPEAKQAQIQKKVTESLNLRKQSKCLLKCAKKAVEIAIEQNEKAAIARLKDCLASKVS